MAARKRTYQTEKTREKIRITQIVNRLQGHVEGKVDMSSTQIAAAKILLGKTMPDLSAADITNHEADERSYEDIRAEMVKEYGEAKTRILLNEKPDLKVVDGKS